MTWPNGQHGNPDPGAIPGRHLLCVDPERQPRWGSPVTSRVGRVRVWTFSGCGQTASWSSSSVVPTRRCRALLILPWGSGAGLRAQHQMLSCDRLLLDRRRLCV